MCLSKKNSTNLAQGTDTINVSDYDDDSDDNFLGAVDSKQKTQWLTEVNVNDVMVTFNIDTGAEVSAISETTLKQLQPVQLKKPSRNLNGPAMSCLEVMGQFTANLIYKHTSCKQTVFVVKDLKQNLLGLPAITSFSSLCAKVRNKLKCMESMGVISHVNEPSLWCSGMVVVLKHSGQVIICVYLKHLNQNVQREFHPLPCVEETLAQLTGARVFTKLDANSGSWQIPLARKLCLLTTFITPFRRYCFHKLPFGINTLLNFFSDA